MPYFAANGIKVTQAWSGAATFPPSGTFSYRFTKLDIFANGTDVVAQWLEEPGGWSDDQAQEGLFRMGFNSMPVETPFVAIRFRVWTNTFLASTGTIDIKCHG